MQFSGCSSPRAGTPRDCTSVTLDEGSFYPYPDITGGRSRLIVAVQNRRHRDDNQEYRKHGAVFYLPATKSALGNPEIFRIKNRDDMPFHPESLSIVNESKDVTLLFILNYPVKEFPVIEVFQINKNDLEFLYRVRGLENLNTVGIVGISRYEFIIANRFTGIGSAWKKNFSGKSIQSVMHYQNGVFRPVITGITNLTGIHSVDPGYLTGTGTQARIILTADRKGGLYTADFRSDSWTNLRKYPDAPPAHYAFPLEGTGVLLTYIPGRSDRYSLADKKKLYSEVKLFRYSDGNTVTIGKGKAAELSGLGRAVYFQNMLILGREFSENLSQCIPLTN